MRFAFFYHSLISDWNHGNAHFLRGIVGELLARGHRVEVFEPEDGWSLRHLRAAAGEEALAGFSRAYPGLRSRAYRLEALDLDRALDGADAVLVHEWNEPELVRRIGRYGDGDRAKPLRFFHDTHHRAVTAPELFARLELDGYDGALVYGRVLRDLYLERGWCERAWVWHEAADVRVFRPRGGPRRNEIVWIGNWGDDERSAELEEFLFEPLAVLGAGGQVYGVRYPDEVVDRLKSRGVRFGGFLPNYRVPEVFSRCAATVHIPRRAYVERLPGIPTIRVFEALACGIPLVCSLWEDVEGLFAPGEDYLVARSGSEMREHLRLLLAEPHVGAALARRGRETILSRHTCAHRADELLEICRALGASDGGSLRAGEARAHA